MKIATAGSPTSKRWRTQEITWPDILARLREPLRTGETFAEYGRMSKAEKSAVKAAAGGFVGGAMQGGRRVAGAVYERWLITLDADEAQPGDWENCSCLCDWALAAYTTHSHSPDKPRMRWLIPLRRAVTREEYEPLARQAALYLGLLPSLDPSTYQPERLMYWPTAAQDGEYLMWSQEGDTLDPDELLGLYGPGEAWRDVSGWPLGDREKDVVRRELRKQEPPEQKRGIVGAFCRTYDVPAAIEEFLPEVYVDAGSGRYTYAAGSTSAGAVLYGDGAWLYSTHATDPAWGLLCNAFDLVRIHLYGDRDADLDGEQRRDTTKLPSYRAMCDFAAGLADVRRTLVEERMEQAKEEFADMAGPGAGLDGSEEARGDTQADSSASEPDSDWYQLLAVNHKTGEPDPTINNALLLLRNDPALRGAVAYNELKGSPVLLRPVPWRGAGPRGMAAWDTGNGETWTDADDAGLRAYMERTWGYKGQRALTDAWLLAAMENSFHPIRRYLDTLEWDGTERLDTALIRWMRAEDTPYTRAATRKWFTAAVARVYEPGRKFDQMLVLVGPQGVGKSRLARAMSLGWFTDSLTSMGGKEAYEGLRGSWIVEIAELAAAKRSEVETIKNFVTKQEDTYRPAYGRHVVVYPRQCVFYGTTNDVSFLKDRTGNRRFWPVAVEGVDRGRLTGLEAEVDQLWAEALARYRAGEPLWMDTDELADAAAEAAAEHSIEDETVGMVQEYLDTPIPANWEELAVEDRRDYIQGRAVITPDNCPDAVRRDVISIPEIRVELFGESRADIGRNDILGRKLADIMNNLAGWKKARDIPRRGPYGRQRVYRRT